MASPASDDSLSLAEARRLALSAQGFGPAAPGEPSAITRAELLSTMARIHLVQLDAVNIVVRSHYLPLFSRLGHYDRSDLDALTRQGALFEYWGHMASLLVADLFPLLRWRMEEGDAGKNWRDFEAWGRAMHGLVERVYVRIRDDGPATAAAIAPPAGRGRRGWSSPSDVKTALEYLFWRGRITAVRRPDFQRVYDLTERILPAHVLSAPAPTRREAERTLVLLAAGACGVATVGDLADYFAIAKAVVREHVHDLAGEGSLRRVEVEGWREAAYVPADTSPAAEIQCDGVLISPFDSLMFTRDRVARLFGFHYKLEMYVPPARRTYGYYVLPLLLGDRLVARVDLKLDRTVNALIAKGCWLERDEEHDAVHAALQRGAERLGRWLGADDLIGTEQLFASDPRLPTDGQLRLI